LSLFGLPISEMSDFKTEVNGIAYK
jgi:hypothetical protein